MASSRRKMPMWRQSWLVVVGAMLCAAPAADADIPYSPQMLDNVLAYAQEPLNSHLLIDVGPDACKMVTEKAAESRGESGLRAATLQYLAGCCHYLGSSGEKNLEAAMFHFGRASELGLAKATSALGMMYDYGIGVRENKARAMSLYRDAAADGEPYATGQIAFHDVMQDIDSQ